MVNGDGPTEQNCSLYVSSAQSLYAPTICILSHQTFAAVFCAAGAATHQRLATPPGPRSRRLPALHSQHICFNLTLSILEMRCNPVKPFSESASPPRLFRLRPPYEQCRRCPSRVPRAKIHRQNTHARTDRLSPGCFLFCPPKQKPSMLLYQTHTCTVFP